MKINDSYAKNNERIKMERQLIRRSVYDGFQQYFQWLEPTSTELANRKSHKKTIEQALLAEFPKFNDLLIIGSHTRGSAINLHSDVDYFAMLGKDDVTWGGSRVSSTTILDRTKRALQLRFKSTDVRIDGPAVVVGFGQGAGAVDVVPGVWVGTTSSAPHYPVYEIPDGSGGWRRTAPQRHTKYLNDEDVRSGYKLAKVVKLLKAWKYARAPKTPVLGFHMEMLLAASGTCVGVKSYQNILLEAFRLIRDRNGNAFMDPLDITGRIDAVATELQREKLVEHARHAVDKATSAISAEVAGKHDDAYYYWKLVFNQNFPSR